MVSKKKFQGNLNSFMGIKDEGICTLDHDKLQKFMNSDKVQMIFIDYKINPFQIFKEHKRNCRKELNKEIEKILADLLFLVEDTKEKENELKKQIEVLRLLKKKE